MKYLLLVYLKKGHTESYYSNELKGLKEYAEFRKFDNFKLFELKEVEQELKLLQISSWKH